MNNDFRHYGPRAWLGFTCIALIALSWCTNTAPAQASASQKESGSLTYSEASNELHSYTNAVIVEKEGEALYEKNCASCHDGGVHRGPNKSMIALMSANSIYKALTDGVMSSQAQNLSVDGKRRVAEYLANSRLKEASAEPELTMCSGDAAKFDFNEPPSLRGWGFNAGNSHYIDPS